MFSTASSAKKLLQRATASSTGFATRTEEKQHLEHLNHALERYIFRVKELEDSVEQLEGQVTVYRTTRSGYDDSALKKLQAELDAAKAALNKDSEERARLQLALTSAHQENDRLRKLVQSLEGEVEGLKARVQSLMAALEEAKSSSDGGAASLEMERTSLMTARGRIRDLEVSIKREADRANAEAHRRVELENMVTSLNEKIGTIEDMHRSQLSRVENELSEAVMIQVKSSQNLRDKYADEMARALAAAKRHYGEAADAFREELKGHYEVKYQVPDESALVQAGQLRGEVQAWKTKFSSKEMEFAGMSKELASAKSRISYLEEQLMSVRNEFEAKLSAKQSTIDDLRRRLTERENMYKDLLDARLKLDAEIDYYQTLLGAEYHRLRMPDNPSQTVSPLLKRTSSQVHGENGSGSGSRSGSASQSFSNSRSMVMNDGSPPAQRVRQEEIVESFSQSTTESGDISIQDIDIDEGFFLVLSNKSTRTVNMGGWSLTVNNEDVEETFRFPQDCSIGGGNTARIISGRGHHMALRNDLVWKEFTTIAIGKRINIALRDENNNDVCVTVLERDGDFPQVVGNSSNECCVM